MPVPEKEMIKAAKTGDVAKVRALVAGDSSLLNVLDSDGSTPLHCACWKGHSGVVEFLISAGANVNAENKNDHWGTTPLHAAAHANQTAIVKLLLAAGANVSAKDMAGRTPLDHTEFHKAKAAAKVIQQQLGG